MRNLPEVLRTLVVAAIISGTAAVQHALADRKADLQQQAQQEAQRLVKKFGSAYQARYHPATGILYVSALDEKTFAATAKLTSTFADALAATLTLAEPSWNIVLVLPTADDYRPLAPARNVVGFYKPPEHTLYSIDRGGVLLHEFTHALHHADFAQVNQKHAPWVCEGLASLFEASRLKDNRLEPLLDGRLVALQKAIRNKTAPAMVDLVKMDWEEFMKNPAISYAAARYLLLYLHEKGQLAKWYKQYKDDFAQDPTGLRAVEQVLGKRVYEWEDPWQQWVLTLKLPAALGKGDRTRLGLEVQDQAQGVIVLSLLAGGVADQAKRLQVNDIIERFDGRDIINSGDLIAAIRAAGTLQTVNIQVVRNGQRITIAQPIGGSTER